MTAARRTQLKGVGQSGLRFIFHWCGQAQELQSQGRARPCLSIIAVRMVKQVLKKTAMLRVNIYMQQSEELNTQTCRSGL